MTPTSHLAPGEAACPCAADPDFRVLKRVHTLNDFPFAEACEGPVRHIVLVDVETTGTDSMTDEVIDIAVVTVEVNARGEITGILSKGGGASRSRDADPGDYHSADRPYRR